MIRNIVTLIVLLAIFVVGLSFAVENAHEVQFNYFVGSLDTALSALLVVAVLVGTLLGALASLVPVMRMKNHIRRLRKREAVAQEEIRNLRTMPIKDAP